MKMHKIQKQKPARTCTKNYAHYKSFKKYLQEDFNKRCGYCDDLDIVCGGWRGFHIDHFKPHSIARFAILKHEYSNLIYSCPYCNVKKSNTWKDIDGFIDPCEAEYDNHICRNNKGKIDYKTDQGKFIFDNLNLGLKRHELLWCIEKLNEQKIIINSKIDSFKEEHEQELELLRKVRDIQNKIIKYTNLFNETI